MAEEELKVIMDSRELLLWTLQHIGKLPKSHRHGLGSRLETKLYDLVDLLIEAKYSRDKADVLRQAGLKLEQFRLLLRSARELHLLAIRSHEFACTRMDLIGKAIGAWRKQATACA